MTDRGAAAGRVLMVGIEGTDLDAETSTALETIQPGGVILFQRNLDTPAQAARLIAGIADRLPRPCLIAVDQEGGRVSRIDEWVGPTPTARSLAGAGEETSFLFGRATARALRSLGFNLDFAPVVDLSEAGAANGIGDRSFGTGPEAVSRLAGAFLDGLQGEGVAGCLKHFPGLGGTGVDSHLERPVCRRTLRELEAADLVPFGALAPRAEAVMIAHASYPALDPDPEAPASLSGPIILDWLRGRLGFRGLVVSDDLEMGAVSPLDVEARAAVAAVRGGCDLILYCRDLGRAMSAKRALVAAAESDPALGSRLEAAAQSVLRTAWRYPPPRPDLDAWSRGREALVKISREVLALSGDPGP